MKKSKSFQLIFRNENSKPLAKAEVIKISRNKTSKYSKEMAASKSNRL